jgi:hypothetical protein
MAFSNITDEMIEAADDTSMAELQMEQALNPESPPEETMDAAGEKHSHASVGYEHPAKNPETVCAGCTRYIPGAKPACGVVVGPIHPNGWCREFETTGGTYETEFQGLDIFIENRPGSVRSGPGWTVRMTTPYGYIRNTEGVDGDHVDCFLGPEPAAEYAHIVRALNPKTEKYDEDKVMLGFGTPCAAQAAFLANYSNPKMFGSMETVPMALFLEELKKKKGKSL